LDRAKVAGDEKDDIVEIGIVVEARNPGWVGRAGVGEADYRDHMSGKEEHAGSPSHLSETASCRAGGATFAAPLPKWKDLRPPVSNRYQHAPARRARTAQSVPCVDTAMRRGVSSASR